MIHGEGVPQLIRQVDDAELINDLTADRGLREALGASFSDQGITDVYDRVRPTYPGAVFTNIVDFSRAQPGDQVLEVGCGPGKATLPLAALGFEVVALDPSEPLIANARQNLRDFPNVTFVVGTLEEADIPPESKKIVVAAQSIHWVDPEERWKGTYQALQDDGTLAYMSNFPDTDNVDDPNSRRERAVDELYRERCPSFPHEWGSLDRMTEDQAASGLFTDPEVVEVGHTRIYGREDYLALQRSYSWVSALDDGERDAFLTEVKQHVGDSEYVTLPFKTIVVMARKKSIENPDIRELSI